MTNPLFDALFAPHVGSERVFLRQPGKPDLTYGAFAARAAGFAHALTGLGVDPGDRVAVQAEKCADVLALYAGCVMAGVVLLPLNTAYTPSELDYFVGNSGARVLVCDPDAAPALANMAASHGAELFTLSAEGGTLCDLAEGAPTDFRIVARSTDDLAAILYTSGTTGRSKGAMLSQRNLLSNVEALAALWQFTTDDVLLHALPIYHTHGLFVATNIALLTGCAMIFLPKFDAPEILSRLPEATAMMGVPTFYTRLLEQPGLSSAVCSNMRLFISGSAPLLPDTHEAWTARTGHRILERYGMTETNMSTSNPYAGDRRPGTVGPPLPGVEVKVCDDSGAERSRGEIGILEVRGPNVCQGYWQMPEKTAEEFRQDGFFITGDLAQMGEDGYVTIVGRAKDLIIAGGLNIYPREIEEVIDGLPDVLESAVIGVPHPDMGEGVVAIVVPAAGATLDPGVLATALTDQLARFKHPRHWVIADALPRNTMGKVQKAALRETHRSVFTAP